MSIRRLATVVLAFASFAVSAAPEQVLQPQPVVIPTESPPAVDPARLAPPPAAKAERAAPARKTKASGAKAKGKAKAPARPAKRQRTR